MQENQEKIDFIRNNVIEWGKINMRNFEWRNTNDPFKILLAELMLHRTRADQVEPVFREFTSRYHTFREICDAGKEKILKQLSCLGLKWRLEHIYSISCILQRKYNGKVPEKREELLSLEGIGPYISSAVLNFAFDKAEPLMDTNTVRVTGRVFGMEINDSSRRKKSFENIMRELVSTEHHKELLWSLIDLAAAVCTPEGPLCEECPVNNVCCYYSGCE